MVHLVALLQPAQDRDRVLDRRLADEHRLEAPLQRRVLLDVLAVLVERGRADRAQLAAREHRLEQVGGVDRALGGARADDRVQLVDEQDDPALGLLRPPSARPSGGPRTRRGTSRRRSARRCRARPRAGRAATRGRRPTTMRWASPSTIAVLPTPGSPIRTGLFFVRRDEHLDHAADLVVAADHRVELALLGAASVRSRPKRSSAWYLSSGFGSVTRCGPRTSPQRREDRVVRRAERAAGSPRASPCESASASSRCSVEMYSSLSASRLALGRLEHARPARRAGAPRTPAAPLTAASLSSAASSSRADRSTVDAELAEHRRDDAALLLEQHGEQVLGGDLGVAALMRPAAGRPGSPPGT